MLFKAKKHCCGDGLKEKNNKFWGLEDTQEAKASQQSFLALFLY